MALACMFSVHIFAVAFHRMLVEATLLLYKLLYPRGYKISQCIRWDTEITLRMVPYRVTDEEASSEKNDFLSP